MSTDEQRQGEQERDTREQSDQRTDLTPESPQTPTEGYGRQDEDAKDETEGSEQERRSVQHPA